MIWLIITLAAFCMVLLLILGKQDEKNSALAAENGILKGRMENLMGSGRGGQRNTDGTIEALTVSDIQEAIRHAGYVPDTGDNWVKFMVSGETYFIDTERLPQIFINRVFNVETKEWEMPLLKQAAHLMSDDLIMVKAIFGESPERTSLRFYVVAMDRNYSSFRDNMMAYLGIISDGVQKLRELYDQLMEEKNQPTVPTNPFLPAIQQENKLSS